MREKKNLWKYCVNCSILNQLLRFFQKGLNDWILIKWRKKWKKKELHNYFKSQFFHLFLQKLRRNSKQWPKQWGKLQNSSKFTKNASVVNSPFQIQFLNQLSQFCFQTAKSRKKSRQDREEKPKVQANSQNLLLLLIPNSRFMR